jgi:hypothetical protein
VLEAQHQRLLAAAQRIGAEARHMERLRGAAAELRRLRTQVSRAVRCAGREGGREGWREGDSRESTAPEGRAAQRVPAAESNRCFSPSWAHTNTHAAHVGGGRGGAQAAGRATGELVRMHSYGPYAAACGHHRPTPPPCARARSRGSSSSSGGGGGGGGRDPHGPEIAARISAPRPSAHATSRCLVICHGP